LPFTGVATGWLNVSNPAPSQRQLMALRPAAHRTLDLAVGVREEARAALHLDA
jgi:hypothetical protein